MNFVKKQKMSAQTQSTEGRVSGARRPFICFSGKFKRASLNFKYTLCNPSNSAI